MTRLWKLVEIAVYGFFLVLLLDRLWTPLQTGNPTLGLRELMEQQQAGLITGAVFGLLVASVVHRLSGPARNFELAVNNWQKPAGPGPTASPMDAIRFFPAHTLVCVCLVAGALVSLWMQSGAAMLFVAGALVAAVALARRLGLEPPGDPATPHRQEKVR